MMLKYSKFWERMLHKPLVLTARTSDDCAQTWRGWGTSGHAAFGIFNRL